ncbi:MAG: 3-dehydroquinate synthase [Deltaproteobacteria bacterium]|nr:3-dehydroquinate synthase [Deltaproteobacteria bacterium]
MARLRLTLVRRVECEVVVERGAVRELATLWRPDWEAAAVIGDDNVIALHGGRLRDLLAPVARKIAVLGFLPGEASKTRATKEDLEDRLLAGGFGRRSCIVALGGGVSLDLAGFVAATYLRGVAHVNVPTTLTAQVDAGIGGKTGVDTSFGKNLVGAFHQPVAVVVDPELLETLPAGERRNGLAEMVKTAVVADEELFSWMEGHTPALAAPNPLDAHAIARCVEAKCGVVRDDETETGRRAVLNFGHTIGHAIESASSFAIPHGVAVAMGMVVEARLAVALTGLPEEHARRVETLISKLGLTPFPRVPFEAVRPFLAADKKNRAGEVRVALPARIGVMARTPGGEWTHVATPQRIEEAYARHLR